MQKGTGSVRYAYPLLSILAISKELHLRTAILPQKLLKEIMSLSNVYLILRTRRRDIRTSSQTPLYVPHVKPIAIGFTVLYTAHLFYEKTIPPRYVFGQAISIQFSKHNSCHERLLYFRVVYYQRQQYTRHPLMSYERAHFRDHHDDYNSPALILVFFILYFKFTNLCR